MAFACRHLCWSEVGVFPVSQWCQAWQEPSSPTIVDSWSETYRMEQQCSVYKSNCSNRSGSSTNLLLWERWGRVNCSTWTALLIGLAAERSLHWQLTSWLVAERRRLLLPLAVVRTRILEWGRFKPHCWLFSQQGLNNGKHCRAGAAVVYLGSWLWALRQKPARSPLAKFSSQQKCRKD